MTQEELNTLNRNRSTGSRANPEREPFVDLAQEAQEYLEEMETAYKKEAGAQPLQGQTTFPGFEEPEEQVTEAETLLQKAQFTGFAVDYLLHPEAALSGVNLSGQLSNFLSSNFSRYVQAVAEELGADPAQIANRETRTPEQEAKLFDAMARDQAARLSAFFDSLYMQALCTLEDASGTTSRQLPPDSASSASFQMREQAVLYFFALHDELTPTKPGNLSPEQEQELQDIFYRLDNFYAEKIIEGAVQEDPRPLYSSLFSAFIELENPEEADAKAIQAALANLPTLESFTPSSHTMPNNALMNALQQKSIIEHPDNALGWDLPVANASGRRKEITAYTMVTYDPGDTGITISGANLTEYERQVSDALVSLWVQAEKEIRQPIFTPDMIYSAMPGGSDKPSETQRKSIDQTIEKLRRLHVVVDATEEMRKRGLIRKNQTYRLDDFFLSVRRAEVKIKNGGQSVIAYKVQAEPIILTYSKMTNQILTAPARYLAVKKVKTNRRTGDPEISEELVAMTPERQSMVGYMLRRIAVMKHDRKNKTPRQSRTILFDTLFRETGTQTDSRTQQGRNRDFCFSVLDYWKATGYIRGYKLQTKGKKIDGITVEF